MSSQEEESGRSIVQSILSSSEDNSVMMAAIVSLVVVVLFVFLLHIYARTSFRSQSLRRRRRRRTPSIASPPPPSFVVDLAAASKGLDSSAIAAIPLFVSGDSDAECVVCLTGFDGGDICRRLPKCGHEFHVECIDMWLGSHSSCPICRAPLPTSDRRLGADPDGGDSAAIADRRDSRVVAENGGGVSAIDIESNSNSEENSSASNGCSPSPPSSLSSPSSSSSSSFGSSLKRMLSRNRSESKVFPAASVVTGTTTESTDCEN